ncbi:hypothetical protein EMCRGX_G007430 [Ephydatia muelleri]
MLCIKWPYRSIWEIHKQRYLLRQCALEAFAEDGRKHFLMFHILRETRCTTSSISWPSPSSVKAPQQAVILTSSLLASSPSSLSDTEMGVCVDVTWRSPAEW